MLEWSTCNMSIVQPCYHYLKEFCDRITVHLLVVTVTLQVVWLVASEPIHTPDLCLRKLNLPRDMDSGPKPSWESWIT